MCPRRPTLTTTTARMPSPSPPPPKNELSLPFEVLSGIIAHVVQDRVTISHHPNLAAMRNLMNTSQEERRETRRQMLDKPLHIKIFMERRMVDLLGRTADRIGDLSYNFEYEFLGRPEDCFRDLSGHFENELLGIDLSIFPTIYIHSAYNTASLYVPVHSSFAAWPSDILAYGANTALRLRLAHLIRMAFFHRLVLRQCLYLGHLPFMPPEHATGGARPTNEDIWAPVSDLC
jgi:hypothetical protein